jgi:hypothetical protein
MTQTVMKFHVWSLYHAAWHRPEFRGYSPDIAKAGRWTWEQAAHFCKSSVTMATPRDYPIAACPNAEHVAQLIQSGYAAAITLPGNRGASFLGNLRKLAGAP